MQAAQEAIRKVEEASKKAKAAAVLEAVEQCVVNAQVINQLLIKREPKTTVRLFDERKVWELVENKAAQLSAQRISLNVSMQNEMRTHIERLERDLMLTRNQNLALQETNISLQSTLEANEENYKKLLGARLEELSAAELQEELEKIDSFEVNVLDRQMFPTPKKPAPKPRDGTVVGGGNLFGNQELEHNKLKY